MDRPTLHPLAVELADDERLGAFAEDLLGAAARVSEAGLPLAPRRAPPARSAARSSCCSPRTPTPATPPRRRPGTSARSGSRCFPSRGVRWDSGLEPPPHLVGERARALDVLAARRARLRVGGRARGARCRRPTRGRRGSTSPAGDEPRDRRASPSSSRSPGYERVERVEERGQFAVRGGIVDVFPTTGREPLRIELFGDEIEAIRAFSPFTQRALRPVDEATVYPAAERRLDLVEPTLLDEGEQPRVPDDLVPRARPRSGPRLRAGGGRARSGRRSGSTRSPLDGRGAARPVPARPAARVRGAAAGGRRARARRGRAGARLLRPRRPARRRRVPAPRRRRSAPRTCSAALEVELARGGRRAPATSRASTSRSRRRGAGSSGATSGSSCSRTRRSSASARRAPTPASAARSSRSPTCAPATTSSTRTTASGSCSASRRRRSRASRATTSSSRFRGEDRLYVPHEQIGKVSRYIGADAKAPALSKLGGKAWQLLKSRARESVQELAGELIALYARRQTAPGRRLRPLRATGSSGSRPSSPTARPRTSSARSRRSRRTSRRRARWTGSSAATSASARPRSRVRAAFAVALNGKQTLMLVPTTVLAQQHWNTFRERFRDFPVAGRDGLALPQAGRRRRRC